MGDEILQRMHAFRTYARKYLPSLSDDAIDRITLGLVALIGTVLPDNTQHEQRRIAGAVMMTVIKPLQTMAPEGDRNLFIRRICSGMSSFDRYSLLPTVEAVLQDRESISNEEIEEDVACAALVYLVRDFVSE